MSSITRHLALGVAVLMLLSCTEMPIIKLNNPQVQRKLSSARHWQLVGLDLQKQVSELTASQNKHCVRIAPRNGAAPPSQFEAFLADVIAEVIVSPAGLNPDKRNAQVSSKVTPETAPVSPTAAPMVTQPPSRAISEDDAQAPPEAVSEDAESPVTETSIPDYGLQDDGFKAYRGDASPADTRNCDDIIIEAKVIPHKGPPGRPPPGQFTLLAAGLLVAHNVVNAFSWGSGVGLVALGETSFWASSGFRSSSTVTEVTVTISRMTRGKRYIAQFTNVYYINDADASLYNPPDPPAKPVQTALQGEDLVSYPAKGAAVADEESPASWRSDRLEIAPKFIPACDAYHLYVRAAYLPSDPKSYQFDAVPATAVSELEPKSVPDGTPQTLQLTFKGIPVASKDVPQATISVVRTDGRLTRVQVNYNGDTCAKKAATTPPGAGKSPVSKSPDVELTPKDKPAGFPVNFCALPVEMTATEKGAAHLTKVETLDGLGKASICTTPGETSKLVTFTTLPDYSKAAKTNSWPLKLTLQDGKTLTKQVNVECVTKPAAVRPSPPLACH